jgi:hypothetical protein
MSQQQQQQQQKHMPQILFFRNLPGYDDDDPQIPNLVHQRSAQFKSNLPLKKIYKSKILLSIKQLHGPPLVGLRDCMKYIWLAICAIDDAIIPF